MERLLKIFRFIVRIILPRMVIVGIDIQDRHIALASLKQTQLNSAGPLLTSIQQIPEETVQEGGVANAQQFRDAVKILLSSLVVERLRSEPLIVLSLPPHSIYTETIIFNVMPEENLAQAVELRLETSLPWPKRDAYYDWRKLNVQDPRHIGVFIAAINKNTVDDYLKIFLEVGRRVVACEFHLISLSRFAAAQTDKPFITVLLDEDGAEFAVMHRGQMFVHFFKKTTGGQLTEMLSFEVRRLVTYAEGELKLKIQEIYIFDKVNLETQLSELEQKTGLEAKMLTALPTAIDPRFLIATGAAKKQFGLEEGINLIPAGSGGKFNEYLISKTINLWTKIVVAFLAVALVSAGLIWLFIKTQTQTIAAENKNLEESSNRQLAQVEKLINDAKIFNTLAKELALARNQETRHGIKLSLLLDQARRQGIRILSANASQPTGPWQVKLFAPSRQNAVAFKIAVEQSGVFSSVAMPLTQLVPETNLLIDAVIQ